MQRTANRVAELACGPAVCATAARHPGAAAFATRQASAAPIGDLAMIVVDWMSYLHSINRDHARLAT
jgi:hypothetical protein